MPHKKKAKKKIEIKCELTLPGAKLPTKAHDQDAGFDLYLPGDWRVHPHGCGRTGVGIVDLGVKIEIPKGYFGLMQERGSTAMKHLCFTVANVIDSGYRGNLHLVLMNLATYPRDFKGGDRIAQLIIIPYHSAAELIVAEVTSESQRGAGSNGSSGQ